MAFRYAYRCYDIFRFGRFWIDMFIQSSYPIPLEYGNGFDCVYIIRPILFILSLSISYFALHHFPKPNTIPPSYSLSPKSWMLSSDSDRFPHRPRHPWVLLLLRVPKQARSSFSASSVLATTASSCRATRPRRSPPLPCPTPRLDLSEKKQALLLLTL